MEWNEETANIIYASNDGYAGHLAASMYSLLDNNRNIRNMDLYVLSAQMCQEYKDRLVDMAGAFHRTLYVVELGDLRQRFDFEIDTRGFDISAMGRLFAPQVLPGTVKKALYLDCDTIVCQSIRPLYETGLGDALVGMVMEPTVYREMKESIGLGKDDPYYNSGVRTETSFDGEGQLTSAIAYVTGSADYTIYVTEGHQESELSNTVTASLGKSNYTIKSVNLMQAGLPGDCNLLIINDPKTDFAENELELVRGKLADGGGVMLLSENLHEQPRLKSLLESMGITVTDGYVAELERYYQQSYYEFFPVLSTESTITAGIDSNSLALVTEALGMRLSAAEGVTLTSFMDTSAYAAGVIAGQRVNGVFSIGASAALVDGGALTVITAPTLIYPEITDAFSNAANLDIFVNAAAELIGSDDTTVIPAHSLQPVYNSVANPGAWSIPCVLLAPALFLAGGFIYWRRRKRA